MVIHVPDKTGRFTERPHYRPAELDRECEQIVTAFLRERHRTVEFPFSTEDLTRLIERDTDDLDLFADLSYYGSDVEGVTEFTPGRKPKVKISSAISSDERRENRLRTTLSHEYGHVRFHAYLWEMEPGRPQLWKDKSQPARHNCRQHSMLRASQTDWMEWQAGYVCGALLMPVSQLRRRVAELQEKHGIFGSVRAFGQHGRALIALVVDSFQVSEEAAEIRLRQLGIVGDQDGPPSLFSN